ncbi:MAG: Mur ligase domain-containing protein, partial [Smithella sp.]
MKLTRLIKGLDIINISGESSGDVSKVCFSADNCESGSLFVAIPGLKNDGHDFINEAVSRGAKFIVYEKDIELPARVTAIKVSGSRRALGILAKNYFGNPSADITLIAVMGTNGKTT